MFLWRETGTWNAYLPFWFQVQKMADVACFSIQKKDFFLILMCE